MNRLSLLASLILPLLASPATAQVAAPADMLNAVLWQQRSVEYGAVARSIYAAATAALPAQLAGCSAARPTRCTTAAPEQRGLSPEALAALPPAVILDLDETALDNTPYEAWLHLQGADYREADWQAWMQQAARLAEQGTPMRLTVPGAAEFTQAAAQQGVKVFYVSNRTCPANELGADCPAVAASMTVMQHATPRFARADEPDAFRFAEAGHSSDKSPRRQAIAQHYRIVMALGDDLGDFVAAADRDAFRSGQAGADLTAFAAAQWGHAWFMLPNAMYGSWERTITRPAQCATSEAPGATQACRWARAGLKEAMLQPSVGTPDASNRR